MRHLKLAYEETIALFREDCKKEPLNCETKKQVLEQHCKATNTCMAIYDMQRDEYHFLHWIFEGADKHQTLILSMNSLATLIHPADISYSIECKIEALKLLNKIAANELTHYKLMYECRIKDKNGKFHRVLHQYMILELNSDNKPCHLRLQMDIIPGEVSEMPPRGMTIMNIRTRKPLVSHAETRFTKREIEVLKCLAEGLDTKDIAQSKDMSINTTYNHRRNILRKTQMSDTGQALLYAKIIGAI